MHCLRTLVCPIIVVTFEDCPASLWPIALLMTVKLSMDATLEMLRRLCGSDATAPSRGMLMLKTLSTTGIAIGPNAVADLRERVLISFTKFTANFPEGDILRLSQLAPPLI